MKFVELGSFEAAHTNLKWPWVAVDPQRQCFAFVSTAQRIETRVLVENALTEGPSFPLPDGLGFPSAAAPDTGHRGPEDGLQAFAVSPSATTVAVTGIVDSQSVVVTVDRFGVQKRSRLDALTGSDFVAHAITFDRSGTRLWLSAETATETALLLIDATTHAPLGVLRSPAFPPPAFHELYVHPQDDAVLLLAACGQDGTFARIAGWSDGPPEALPTALDDGSGPVGFVGFSSDGAHVHLVEADALRTHAWPSMEELSSVEFTGDFVASFSGVVLGSRILVDGHDSESGNEDAVLSFDVTGIRSSPLSPPFPTGMWVSKLGRDLLITVSAKGEPAQGQVFRIASPTN